MSARNDSEGDVGHVEFDALAAGWALHALEPDDEHRFAVHLPGCETCRVTVAELEATLGQLAYAVPEVDPPADLLDRIHLAMADDAPRIVSVPDVASRERDEEYRSRASIRPSSAAGPSPLSAPLLPSVPRQRHASRWLATAAAVVAIALVGWNVVLQQQVSREQTREAAAVKVLTRVAVSDNLAKLADPQGTPVGLVLKRGNELEVVSMGMPRNSAGQRSYWLWAVPASDDKPIPMGRFDVAGSAAAVHTIGDMPAGLAIPAAFAVSVEPGTAKPVSPTKVIASGKVAV